MLLRRLFLIAGFAWPTFSPSPSAFLASQIRELISDGTDRGELFSAMFSLVDAIPVRERRRQVESVGDFANGKLRLDAWIEDLLLIARTYPTLDEHEIDELGLMAASMRESDPMTKKSSLFAKQLHVATEANASAVKAERAQRELAASEADNKLSKYFADAAKKDGSIGGALATAAIATLGGSFGLGYELLGNVQQVTWSAELAKLALTLPLFAVSVYLGRLSSHYRDAARWAKSASIQLNTIDAFIQGVENPEARDEMRLQLGRRIFGDPGLGGDAKNPDTQDAVSIIDSVANVANIARRQ
jgi:hypothetical protein